MRVLIQMSYPKFATQLEVAQNHIDCGDEVTIVECRGELLDCNWNKQHLLDRCWKCRHTRSRALGTLTKPVRTIPFLELSVKDQEELRALPNEFHSADELRNFKVGSFDAGMAVLSTLIDRYRNPNLDVGKIKEEVRKHLVPCVALYRSFQRYIDQVHPDLVYVFNGRYCHTKPVLRACQETNTDCSVLEDGWDRSHYTVWHNTTPHSKAALQKNILDTWSKSSLSESEKIERASSWFENRAKGLEVHDRELDRSFVKQQIPDALPEGFDSQTHNIAIFNSSEDEWAAVSDEWAPTLYRNQLEGIRQIVGSVSGLKRNVHLYLRIHPNLGGTSQVESLLELKSEFLTVVPPTSAISSYAILRACDTTLSFGSTMGVEATFHGKPSVLANCSIYDHLGCAYIPITHEELMELLVQPLAPKPKTSALPYAFYYSSYGIPFKHYLRPVELHVEGTMNGSHYQESILSKYGWRAVRSLPIISTTLDQMHLAGTWKQLVGDARPS